MARDVESLPPDDEVKGQVGRRLANAVLTVVSLGVLVAWAYFGFYQLDPGENAVILTLGRYSNTVETPGLKWHLPPPIQAHDIVRVDLIEREQFGFRSGESEASELEQIEGVIQTKDNNVAHVGFVVQYKIKDAFRSRYRITDPRATLRDTAQASIREIIGKTPIDGVLSELRGDVQRQTKDLLQDILDRYESGLRVERVELTEVQPPPEVQDAFDDVIASAQDKDRKRNEAEAYANEVLPQAEAEASELRQAAQGYRDAKVAEAEGEAARFSAVLVEYRKAPEVTRTRLYLETMEEVMPRVQKVIIEPGTNLLPYLPLGQEPRAPAPVPPPAPAAGGSQ